MRRFHIALTAMFALAFAHGPAAGQEGHVHGAGSAEKLGTVHFEISCGPGAQRDFDRAVALLHSFQYEEAEKAFARIAGADPSCAMAFWGVAMCNYHPIWSPTTHADFDRGRAAVEEAMKVGGKTERERAYISAVEAYYAGPASLDVSARKAAYESAMEGLHQRYPDDMEGTIFYALAILGTATATDRTYANQKQAAALLNSVLPMAPDHPGVAHYLIHSLDYPSLAELALPAARAYSKIAASSPHAQHMPSHIFTRLGLWQESIQSNLAAARAARDLMARTHPGATHFDELHAMDYLVYAYLQLGRDDSAKAVVDVMHAVPKVDQETFSAAYAFAAAPARYALERHRWTEAAHLTGSPTWFSWKQFGGAEALTHFARGIGAARSGDLPAAREALAELDTLHQALAGVKEGYNWGDQVEVQRRALLGWIAHAGKKDGEALRLLGSAADLEDSIDKNPVTPGALLPAREQLGDLLLEVGKRNEAIAAYNAVLKTSPGRRNSLLGLKAASAPAGPAASNPTSSTWKEAGALFQQGDWKRAAEAYAAIAKREPGSGRAWYRLGFSLARQGKFADAVPAYLKAEAIGNNPLVMFSLSGAYAQMGDSTQAFSWLEKAAANGFRQIDQMKTDADLERLRASTHFAALVSRMERNARPCAHDPEHRQLDFWLGDWVVKSPDGNVVGHNSITVADGDCAIHEHWTDVQGGEGQSFNFYNQTTRKWHQSWVDDQGQIAEFDGTYREGAMRLEGFREGPGGSRIPARLTLTPSPDGSVRQLGENSADGGRTWTVLYDLTYMKKQ